MNYENQQDLMATAASLASVEAEQNIIGGLLIEPSAMSKCRDLAADKFYQAQHKII